MEPAGHSEASVDFYFDFASPYAYFAHGRIAALCARHGLVLRRRPILLWAVLQEQGLPLPLQQPAKRRYLERDMVRSAEFLGLPFVLPAQFTPSSHLAARLFLAFEARWPEQVHQFTEALFAAGMAAGRDIADAGVLAALAAPFGAEAGWVEDALRAQAGKAALRRCNAEAVQRGVWGSPYWFLGEEAYFGADRIEQFERSLARCR